MRGSLAVLAGFVAVTFAGPARLDSSKKLVKRSSSSPKKLLIASSPSEAAAWDKYAHDFAAAVTYTDTAWSDVGLLTVIRAATESSPAVGIKFIPMLSKDDSASSFASRAQNALATGEGYVAGMNEPNEDNEDAMSPGDAARLWKSAMEPLRSSKVKLISPALSSNPNFAQWYKDFKQACSGCHIDIASVHYYNKNGRPVSTGLVKFEEYIKAVRAVVGKDTPIWLTETGNRDTSHRDAERAWLRNVWKKAAELKVEVVGAFTHMANAPFVDSDGKLTATGQQWADL